jgi:PLD-like domain
LTQRSDGLTLAAYRGDGSVMLAFDASEELSQNLAGFALEVTAPSGSSEPILNRLAFETPITAETTPEERTWTPTSEAPIQKFRWIHFPADVEPGTFTYRATAMRFKTQGNSELDAGPTVELGVDLIDDGFPAFELGFTRGYLSSQAYAEHFANAPVAPSPATIDFDSSPFEERWAWLGYHARHLIFDLLTEVERDPGLTLDVFAYDLNEPDVIRAFAQLGPRLRLYLDDSESHKQPGDAEVAAAELLRGSAGEANVKTGHFSRFSHDKILIARRDGVPVKVLSGSANFSIRGLYVQANNVFVFEDPQITALYGQVFDQIFSDAHGFSGSELASKWFDVAGGDGPASSVSFSPHHDPSVSLNRVAEAIASAQSSVLFSVMDLSGGGDVMAEIAKLPSRDLYAFGTTQRASGELAVTSPNHPAVAIPFAYLHDKVPEPFKAEISGGAGQVIHNKFVVVDFNGEAPVVFAGSSNLAEGGEEENGDNLVAFSDPRIAETYAVEAIRLIDHYRFRAVQQTATTADPLVLKTHSADWVPEYYDPGNEKFRERTLFVPASPAP